MTTKFPKPLLHSTGALVAPNSEVAWWPVHKHQTVENQVEQLEALSDKPKATRDNQVNASNKTWINSAQLFLANFVAGTSDSNRAVRSASPQGVSSAALERMRDDLVIWDTLSIPEVI